MRWKSRSSDDLYRGLSLRLAVLHLVPVHAERRMKFSASRITSLLQCERAWAWHYLLGFRAEKTKALDIGTETHEQMQLLVRDGRPIDMSVRSGPLASALEPHVRELIQKPGVLAEGEFNFVARHAWTGFIDLETPDEVTDYKTSADPDKWAPTPEQLLFDPQAILYAKRHLMRFAGDSVKIRWLYVSKQKPHPVLPVRIVMTRAHAERGFEVLEQLADRALLIDAKTEADILRLPLAPGAPGGHCKAYRGCPHRITCGTFDWSI
jgi:RecB family exonuclease